ncbi:MAG: InlB B-repeat-containing protein, partial [Enterocloster sp.]
TTQTISTAVPTWTGYVFAGWTSNEVQATSGSFIMPEANVTFTATWKEDANGDGEPDDAETKYSITYSDGEANGNAQNMPQNETDILSGTTRPS